MKLSPVFKGIVPIFVWSSKLYHFCEMVTCSPRVKTKTKTKSTPKRAFGKVRSSCPLLLIVVTGSVRSVKGCPTGQGIRSAYCPLTSLHGKRHTQLFLGEAQGCGGGSHRRTYRQPLRTARSEWLHWQGEKGSCCSCNCSLFRRSRGKPRRQGSQPLARRVRGYAHALFLGGRDTGAGFTSAEQSDPLKR